MAARRSVDVSGWLDTQLAQASPDLLKTFVEALMGAEADAVCGAAYGQRTPERVNSPERLPAAGLGHPRRHRRAGDPQAAAGQLGPGLAARRAAAAPSRHWSRSWRPATCWACPPAGWSDWSRPLA